MELPFKRESSSCCSLSVKRLFCATIKSYWISSPNCRSLILEVEFCTLSPVNSRATAPHTPKTVINIRFLYRKIFLAVTLWVKLILFQIGVKCSRKIFDPFVGALGNNKAAGFSFSSLKATMQAGRTALKTDRTSAAREVER